MKSPARMKDVLSVADVELLREELINNGRQSAARLRADADELARLVQDKRRAAQLVYQFPGVWRFIEAQAKAATPSPEKTPPATESDTSEHFRFVESVRIELTAAEAKALSFFQRRFNKESNLAHVAYWILMLALQHPSIVGGWLGCLTSYCAAEDLNQRRHLVGCVAARSEYRRTRAKG